jgi:hypothetical protein
MHCTRIASIVCISGGMLAHAVPSRAQVNKPDGHWQGTLEREGAALAVRFDFQTDAAGVLTGRFSSESQRTLDYPVEKVSYASGGLHWELGGAQGSSC